MDYQKIYDNICKRGQVREKQGYMERHHIIMKSHGGSDSPTNTTLLTAREHFICHWLLARIHPNDYKAQAAFKMISDVKYNKRYTPSSRVIAEARENAAKLDSLRKQGKKLPKEQVEKRAAKRRGTYQSEATKAKIAEALRGRSRKEIQGRVYVNDGNCTKMVSPDIAEEYLDKGWQKGRLPYTRIYNGKIITQ